MISTTNKLNNIFIIVNDPLFIKQHLLPLLEKLNNKFNTIILTNYKSVFKNNIPYDFIHIPIKRKPSPFFDLIAFLRIIWFIKIKDPVLLISFTPKGALLNALTSIVFANKKYIHYFTGQIWINMNGYKRTFYKLLDLLVIKKMNETLCDSKSQSNFLVNHLNLNESERPKVLLSGSISGVNIDKFKYSLDIRNKMRKDLNIGQTQFVFLFVGRLKRSKGIYTLLNSFKKFNDTYKDDILLLVGPVEEKDIFLKYKNSKNIKHIDYVEDTSAYYQLSDLLVLPSFREGFGSVVIEAGSTSLPSIVSEIPGVIDAIELGKSALTFKVSSEASLLEAMYILRKNKGLRDKLGNFARTRVEKNFSEDDVSGAFFDFVSNLIS